MSETSTFLLSLIYRGKYITRISVSIDFDEYIGLCADDFEFFYEPHSSARIIATLPEEYTNGDYVLGDAKSIRSHETL